MLCLRTEEGSYTIALTYLYSYIYPSAYINAINPESTA